MCHMCQGTCANGTTQKHLCQPHVPTPTEFNPLAHHDVESRLCQRHVPNPGAKGAHYGGRPWGRPLIDASPCPRPPSPPSQEARR